MRYFAAKILYFMGVPYEVIVSFDPIIVLFVVVFSTELILIYIIFLIWVFGKRGSVKKYHDGYSGFPSDMVRRADTSDKVHQYDLTRPGKVYRGDKRSSVFGTLSIIVLVPTILLFLGIYAYSLLEKGMFFR